MRNISTKKKNKEMAGIIVACLFGGIAITVMGSDKNKGGEAPPIPLNGIPSTPNFDINEFHSKDGAKVPAEYYGNLQMLMNELQKFRDYVGKAIKISSGYRSKTHNSKVGGASNSFHLKAMAADIKVDGMTAAEVQTAIKYGNKIGLWRFGGIGVYKTFTHVDVRAGKAEWKGGNE